MKAGRSKKRSPTEASKRTANSRSKTKNRKANKTTNRTMSKIMNRRRNRAIKANRTKQMSTNSINYNNPEINDSNTSLLILNHSIHTLPHQNPIFHIHRHVRPLLLPLSVPPQIRSRPRVEVHRAAQVQPLSSSYVDFLMRTR